MLKKMIFCILIAFGLIITGGCERDEKSITISLENKEKLEGRTKLTYSDSMRIAVGGMITPKEGFIYYKNLLDYIEKKTARHVDFVDRESYEDIYNLLKAGDVDVAFVCSGPYVDGHKDFGLELIAAPQAYGEAVYYSYIIVAKDSPIRNFKELRGKTFAFTDPMSNTGTLVPKYILSKMNETPDSFFRNYIYSHSHDKAIQAVVQHIVDGAAVDSLIWEYLNRINPGLTAKTRIIMKSPPYGIPPVVVRPGLDPEVKKQIQNILFTAHQDEKGKKILSNMMIDKFVTIDDSAYDSIREMKAWVEAQNRKGTSK